MLEFVKLKNGETISYREQGKNKGNKTFIMLHGNMTSSKHLDVFMEQISKDIHVIAPDLRGFGESSYNQPFDSLKELADDIVELAEALGVHQFIVGGWSTGGGIAMIIAGEYPERVEKLVLIESVGIKGYPIFKKDATGQPILTQLLTTKEELAEDAVQVLPLLNAYASKDKETLKMIWNSVIYTHKQPSREHYDEYLEDMLTQRNLIDVDYALMYFNISREHNGVTEGNGLAYTIKAETLILQGERDYVVPMAMAEGIKSALGDLARMVTGDWGHSPFIDDPKGTMNKINEFIG